MKTFIFLALLAILLAVDCPIHGTLVKTRVDLSIQVGQEIDGEQSHNGMAE